VATYPPGCKPVKEGNQGPRRSSGKEFKSDKEGQIGLEVGGEEAKDQQQMRGRRGKKQVGGGISGKKN